MYCMRCGKFRKTEGVCECIAKDFPKAETQKSDRLLFLERDEARAWAKRYKQALQVMWYTFGHERWEYDENSGDVYCAFCTKVNNGADDHYDDCLYHELKRLGII